MQSAGIQTPRFSFVVVTFNSANCVADCLTSIGDQTVEALDIIAVDNASTDGTAELIESRFPTVRLIRNPRNLGFGAAVNIGVSRADGQLVAVLNPDVSIDRHWSAEMLRALVSVPRCGAAEGKLLLAFRPTILNCGGSYVNVLGFGCASRFGEGDHGERASALVTYPSGAAFAVRKEVFQAVGGFDESYFLYHEDADLGLRLHSAGWSIVYTPLAVAYHDFQSNLEPWKVVLLEKNRWKTLAKNMPARYFVVCGPLLAAAEIGLLVYLLPSGLLGAKLRAALGFFEDSRRVLRARKSLGHVQAGTSDLTSLLTDHFPNLIPSRGLLTRIAMKIQSGYHRAFVSGPRRSSASSSAGIASRGSPAERRSDKR